MGGTSDSDISVPIIFVKVIEFGGQQMSFVWESMGGSKGTLDRKSGS